MIFCLFIVCSLSKRAFTNQIIFYSFFLGGGGGGGVNGLSVSLSVSLPKKESPQYRWVFT